MQRSLWGGSQRRTSAGAIQGRPAPPRQGPPRPRYVPQRNRPIPVADEPRGYVHAFPEPSRPASQSHGFSATERDLYTRTSDASTDGASFDIEAERHRQTEIARIRREIMEIAREVADLRRSGHDGSEAAPERSRQNSDTGAPRTRAAEELLRRAPDTRNRSQKQELPPPPNGRHQQPIERPHRHAPKGGAGAAVADGPARGRQPTTMQEDVLGFARTKSKPVANRTGRSPRWKIAVRAALLTGGVLVGTAVITLALWGKLLLPGYSGPMFADTTASIPGAKGARSAQFLLGSAGESAIATYPFEIPDTYGVYAVTDGHLTPLDPLPVRIPDARVAISNPISKPAPAPIPTGNLQFAVYHRELATSVPESAAIRIVAKVMQATAFAGGKPKPVPVVEDVWAVRGGSIDLRIAPVAANREMVLIRPADPAFELPPGRYVLIFKNQAYDFSVAGDVTDPAHCLERSELEDRTVYSECRVLPASSAKR